MSAPPTFTAGPWHAKRQISKSFDDPGYRLVAVVGPTARNASMPQWCVYAERDRMVREGKGCVWGSPEDDARLLASSHELLHALAESTGMLSALMDILAGRQRASQGAADEVRAQHVKNIELLKKVAPRATS